MCQNVTDGASPHSRTMTQKQLFFKKKVECYWPAKSITESHWALMLLLTAQKCPWNKQRRQRDWGYYTPERAEDSTDTYLPIFLLKDKCLFCMELILSLPAILESLVIIFGLLWSNRFIYLFCYVFYLFLLFYFISDFRSLLRISMEMMSLPVNAKLFFVLLFLSLKLIWGLLPSF